jgi:hypothetical protein
MGVREMPFTSDSELVDYVESQIQLVLPVDWRFERLEGRRLGWRIVPPGRNLTDYLMYSTGDRSSLLFVYGNSDAGPLRLEQMLLNAKMLNMEALHLFPLSRMVEHLLKTCELNRWGLT